MQKLACRVESGGRARGLRITAAFCVLQSAFCISCGGDVVNPGAAAAPPVVQDNVIVDDTTEKLIRGGLKYLAAKQSPNGSWNAGGGEHHVARTAQPLTAFLAARHTPNGGAYGK